MADDDTGTQEATKPEDVPDKFWDAANKVVNYKAWGTATKQYETDFHERKAAEAAAGSEEGGLKINAPDPDAERSADQIVAAAGLDPAVLATKYMEKSELDATDYDALKQQGVPRALVDAHLQGQLAIAQGRKAQADQSQTRAIEMVGGADALKNLTNWATSNLNEVDRTAMNKRLEDPAQIEGAVRELRDRHTEAIHAGNAQPLITSGGPAPAGGGPSTPDAYNALIDQARAYQAANTAVPEALAQQIEAAGGNLNDLFGMTTPLK